MQHVLKRSILKVGYAVALGLICGLFAWALKTIAEGAERGLYNAMNHISFWFLMIAPLAGLLLIYFITKKVFRTRITGIREVIDAIREPIQVLKPVKAVLHFFTGAFTIMFGGSTGIEVSTVVASASFGSWAGREHKSDVNFQQYLIMAGAAAGIAGLFKSPLGGIFFAVEVLMVSFSLEMILLVLIAAFTAFAVRSSIDGGSLFHVTTHGWKILALPFYVLFSVMTSYLSVCLTRSVIGAKTLFNSRFGGIGRIWIGGLFLGLMIVLVNPLYGEGYGFIDDLLINKIPTTQMFGVTGTLLLVILLVLKPLATSSTLASGGDGGVFAPSLFLGAVAGFIFAQCANYFGAAILPVNFIIVGMAAILSASLHAPLTAAFLAMSVTGSYELFVPILLTSFLSSFLAKKIYPFTVYSYSG